MALTDLLSAATAPQKECAHEGCNENVSLHEVAHKLSVGFSHYKQDPSGAWQRSYMQIYHTPFACSRDHAVAAIHARIDAHAGLTHGSYNPEIQHPAEADLEFSQADKQRQAADASYHDSPTAANDLPKACAICSADTSREVYVPHVDECAPPSGGGYHYQDAIRSDPHFKDLTLSQATFGACSADHARELAHIIVDEVLQPCYQAKLKALEEAGL